MDLVRNEISGKRRIICAARKTPPGACPRNAVQAAACRVRLAFEAGRRGLKIFKIKFKF